MATFRSDAIYEPSPDALHSGLTNDMGNLDAMKRIPEGELGRHFSASFFRVIKRFSL